MSENNGWPYHLYSGNDSRKQGTYVKCANNPCMIHGGNDIYASSPEDAYAKAYDMSAWGLTSDKIDNISISQKNNEKLLTPKHNTVSIKVFSKSKEKHSRKKKVALKSTASVSNKMKNVNSSNKYLVQKRANILNKLQKHNIKVYDNDAPVANASRLGINASDSPIVFNIDNTHSTKEIAEALYSDEAQFAENHMNDLVKRTDNVFLNDLTKDERNSISDYTDVNYYAINPYLNGVRKISDKYELKGDALMKEINNISSGLSKTGDNIVDKDTVFYRCRYLSSSDESRGKEELAYYREVAKSTSDESRKPSVIRADYMSTFMKMDNMVIGDMEKYPEAIQESHDKCEYIILAPKGTKGAAVTNWSENPSENEFLLDKGYEMEIEAIFQTGKLNEESGLSWERRGKENGKGCAPVIALRIIPKN